MSKIKSKGRGGKKKETKALKKKKRHEVSEKSAFVLGRRLDSF